VAAMCIIDKNKHLESIIQIPTLGKYEGKVKIKTSKRGKTVRRTATGISDILIETQRKSAMENKGSLKTLIKK
jgi:hypothetical protein